MPSLREVWEPLRDCLYNLARLLLVDVREHTGLTNSQHGVEASRMVRAFNSASVFLILEPPNICTRKASSRPVIASEIAACPKLKIGHIQFGFLLSQNLSETKASRKDHNQNQYG